jgi:5'-3' exonuclease
MNTKTLLVDASYLLKRSFHGAKGSYTKSGYMGGVYGFIIMIRKFIKDHNINKVVLVWDGQNGGIARHRIDPIYKSNRKDKSWYVPIELTEAEIRAEKEKDQSILLQRVKVQMYAEELFLRQIEVKEIEADDLIAAYCMKHHNDEEIILYTNDSDFLQLLTSLNISIYLESVKGIVEAGNFFQHFPYFYKNALTMKILCGDKADKIQGIKGLGEDTLIEHFPELKDSEVTVRHICKRSVEINEERKAKKLKPLKALANITENVDRLRTNHQLMNLFQPFMNEEAYQAIAELNTPLSDKDRGGDALYKMMMEDDFLSLYSNYGNYSSFVQPFYLVISREKDLLKKYSRNYLNS